MKAEISSRRDWLCGLLLVFTLVFVYGPVLQAGFIWDDDDHVTANPCIVGPLGFNQIWTTDAARYYPLVLSTFWLEHAWWGLNPKLFHLVNVLMQAACGLLLWRVLLSLRIPGAWLGAALWTFHPVQVETVAWITELKNTQSGLFYLLSILFFVRHLRANRDGVDRWSYPLTLLCALLAMLSKSATVILPLVLILCAWWVKGHWQLRDLIKIAPVYLFAAAASLLAVDSVARHGVVSDLQAARSIPERLVTAGDVFWFYLGKLIWPHPLIFIYPRWQIYATSGLSWLPLAAMAVVLGVAWGKRETWGRPWFFALSYFLVALLPVLGLVNHYFLIYSFVADHLQYLASMGPLALAGAGLSRLAGNKSALQAGLGVGLLAVFGAIDWQRAHVFANNEKLWADTLAQNPACWMAHTNLAAILAEKGNVDAAVAHYHQALQLNPDDAEGHYDLGQAYSKQGRGAEAIAEFKRAVEIHPDFVLARINLGWALTQAGKPDEAAEQYQKALETNPHFGLAHYYIGLADLQKGHSDDALAEFREAQEDAPGLIDAHDNYGLALFNKGRLDEAIQQFEEALSLNPASADVCNSLGLALLRKGQVSPAIAAIQRALQLDPGMADAHFNLGNAYLAAKQIEGAVTEFEAAVKLEPNYADAHNNLAVALFTAGRLDEAVAQFQEFVRLNPGDLHAKENLAKAQELLARQKATGGN